MQCRCTETDLTCRSPSLLQEASWVVPPKAFSRGEDAVLSAAESGPEVTMAELTPGELFQLKHTLEDGGFESETQERGSQQPPPAYGAAVAPLYGPSSGHFYPYDLMFLTGQYPPGTYIQSSSSIEHGRDDWQENHYIGFDYPTYEDDHSAKWVPGDMEQSVHHPGFAGPGGVKDMGQRGQASDYVWGH